MMVLKNHSYILCTHLTSYGVCFPGSQLTNEVALSAAQIINILYFSMQFLAVIIIVEFTNHVNIWHAVLVSPSICDKRICIGLWKWKYLSSSLWRPPPRLHSTSFSSLGQSFFPSRDVILQCPHLSEKRIWRIFSVSQQPQGPQGRIAYLLVLSTYRRNMKSLVRG